MLYYPPPPLPPLLPPLPSPPPHQHYLYRESDIYQSCTMAIGLHRTRVQLVGSPPPTPEELLKHPRRIFRVISEHLLRKNSEVIVATLPRKQSKPNRWSISQPTAATTTIRKTKRRGKKEKWKEIKRQQQEEEEEYEKERCWWMLFLLATRNHTA